MIIINLKKCSVFILILILIPSISPILFTEKREIKINFSFKNPDSSQKENLRVGAVGFAFDWDPAISRGTGVLSDYFIPNCLESLFWIPSNSITLKPLLATSIQYEYWPEEMNSIGFLNRGGVKAVNVTLRQGVTFHDGSNWNATVAKWNIDRIFIITGNLTGTGDLRNKDLYWKNASDFIQFFTASWNLSHVIGQPGTYNGLSSTHPLLKGMFPTINKTIITQESDSGGKIRIEYNDWNSGKPTGLDFPMISMHTYKNFFAHGIYGWEDIHPPGTHFVGTGPYIFREYDEWITPSRGYMDKNFNYWNRTALEIEGWFNAEEVTIFSWPTDELGVQSRNIAMITHTFDYGIDSPHERFDYEDIIYTPYINYIERGVSDHITTLMLNCINETWMSWGPNDPRNPTGNDYVALMEWFGDRADGIPRLLRKAISYVFDYDTYIHIISENRDVRAGGILGIDNVYYNPSIPLPEYNITYAREILLNAEPDQYTWRQIANFSAKCAARGLDEFSTDADWQWIADNDPLWELSLYWDDYFNPLRNLLYNNLRNIGIALAGPIGTYFIPTNMWDKVSTYWLGTFPVLSAQAWPLDWPVSDNYPWACLNTFYRDPNNGIWRTDPWAPTTDSNFDLFPWFNLAFTYNSTVDYWLDKAYFSNYTGRQKIYNNLANWCQNYQYPWMYISQGKKGVVHWIDWEMNFNREMLHFANFRYIGGVPERPGNFILSTDADTPDIDGSFNLTWSTSDNANNYSVCSYNSLITTINGTITTHSYQTANSPFLIFGLPTNEYYFVVVAHNKYGNTFSNNIHVFIQIPEVPAGNEISGYVSFLFIGILLSTSLLLIKRRKIRIKKCV